MQPTPPSAGPPADSWPPRPATPPPSKINGFSAKLQADSSGLLTLLVVLVVGVVLAYVLWVPFAQPAVLINKAVGDKNCASKLPGTGEMRTCAATVAAWKMLGPVVIGVLVFLLRRPLARLITKWSAKLHPGGRPLVAPLLATLLFLLVWAGAHSKTGGQTGLFPQQAFPALVGVYTFCVVRYGPALQRKMTKFFDKRDKLPVVVRALITVGIPAGISLLITNQDRVSKTAQKEQFVVVLGLLLAYLMLSPRGGDIASRGRRLLAQPTRPEASG